MSAPSQADRIAEFLSDGEWHTTSEILRAVPAIVHSRVADLRRRGLVIEHMRTGPGAPGSSYRLLLGSPSVPSHENHLTVGRSKLGEPSSGGDSTEQLSIAGVAA